MNFMRAILRLDRTSTGVSFHSETIARRAIMGVIALALVFSTMILTSQPVAAQTFQIFVPMVSTDGSAVDEGGLGGSGEAPTKCALNEEEAAVAVLMENDSGQRRNNPVCDPILSQVARARARDMALRGYFSHTNPDGKGPNILVLEAGYPLPDWYSDTLNANNIESIGAGHVSPDKIWQGWLDSQSHRTHVLGTQDFYAEQEAYGVGYYFNPDSPSKHYWVFLSAPVEASE